MIVCAVQNKTGHLRLESSFGSELGEGHSCMMYEGEVEVEWMSGG